MISLNDKITLTDGNKGTVKYIGCIDGKKGVFYGIDLLREKGKNNGTVNNILYFQTATNKSGKFVTKSKLNMDKIIKQTNSSKLSYNSELIINETKGKIKYVGIPNCKQNKSNSAYYGIQLAKPVGNTDGKFLDTKVSYFKCDKNKGIYVKVNDIHKQNKNKNKKKNKNNTTKQQKKIKKHRANRSSIITISKTIQLKEKNETEVDAIINSLPTYIKQQWNEYFNIIIHIKHKPQFVNILIHLNMMQYHLNDISQNDMDEKKSENLIIDKAVLFEDSLKFLLSTMTQLGKEVNNNDNRILFLNDANVIKYYLNGNLHGMVILLKYFGWDKMKDMFAFFCDGVDSQISIEINVDEKNSKKVKKTKKKKNTLFIENAINFLHAFIENIGSDEIQISHKSDDDKLNNNTQLKINTIEEEVIDNINEEKDVETNINAIDIDIDVPDYSLSIIEKLFEKKVRKNEEKESYICKSFQSEIPIYAKKTVIYDTLNITVYKYEWESFPEHQYKHLMLRAETNQFVRFLITCSFNNALKDNIKLASDKDEIIITKLAKSKKSNINSNEANNVGRIELKIRVKPYQKRDLLLAKVCADNYKWSWKVQQRNTSKKDNNIYLKLAEKHLSGIKTNYDQIYIKNDLQQISNVKQLHNKLFDELKVPFFMDMNFLPFNESIMSISLAQNESKNSNQDENEDNRYVKCFETSLFKRVIDMKLTSDYESYLFCPDRKISFRNIEQGNLPNCGFVASLVSVAHKKALLIRKNIFNIDNMNEFGIYTANLYFNGILTEYVLDDFIPCYCYGHKQPSFTKHVTNIISNKNRKNRKINKKKSGNKYNIIWVLLLEKCMAKLYGGYDRLSNMYAVDAFAILTGYPSVEIDYATMDNAEKQSAIWNKLIKFGNNKNILLTSSCHPKRGRKSINDLFGSSWKRKNEFFGLFANKDGHVWSIIRVVEYKTIKLICLRNPWGETLEDSSAGNGLPGDRWKGKYSRYDTMSWTKQLLQETKPNLKYNDGTFWMSLNDYMHYFYNLSICYCFNNDYSRLATKCSIKYCVSSENQSMLFPKIIIDIRLNDEMDEKVKDELENKGLILKWVGIIQQDMINKNNTFDVKPTEYLDTCLFIGVIDENNNIKPITLTNVSAGARRINYGKQALNIRLKANNKYILIPYSTGLRHAFCPSSSGSDTNITITSFISGNRNNAYNIKMINNDFVNVQQIYDILSNYIKISNDFKKSKKNENDFIFTDKTFNGMIIAAWFHKRNDFKFKTKIKFKLNNCLPAVGFDYNNYLIKHRKKFCGQKNKNDPNKAKKYSWTFNVENYISNQVCLVIMKKIKNESNQFGYSYSFDNGNFESC